MIVSMGVRIFLPVAMTHILYQTTWGQIEELDNPEFGEIDAGERGWQLQFHLVERMEDAIRHHQVAEPFSVSRHDVPRGAIGSGYRYHVFKRPHVFSPELPFFEVTGIPLPALLRILNSLLQPLLLFFLGDVQEKFQYGRAVFHQHFLEFSNLVEPAFYHSVGYPAMHARNQHIFVMRSVKNADKSFGRNLSVHTPQKVASQFVLGRGFERDDFAALRVYRGHH